MKFPITLLILAEKLEEKENIINELIDFLEDIKGQITDVNDSVKLGQLTRKHRGQ